MAEKLTKDLDIIQNSGIEITVDPMTSDLNIIQKLDDEPNDVGGLSAAELKAKFDEAGNIIKGYINDSLIPQVLSEGITEAQRQENEAARQSAETARETAETGRVGAETARESAESARESAETARQTAETGRVSAEAARVSAESVRVSAESARQTAETERRKAENQRQFQESVRIHEEDQRDDAEFRRERAEADRVTAESARKTAESARVSAESARTSAETQRQADQAAFFQGVSASAEMLEQGAQATAQATPQNGSFHVAFGIPSGGPAGEAGKSAYQYAVDGGYTGTEEEFRTLMGSGPWLPAKDGVVLQNVRIGGRRSTCVLEIDGSDLAPSMDPYDRSKTPLVISKTFGSAPNPNNIELRAEYATIRGPILKIDTPNLFLPENTYIQRTHIASRLVPAGGTTGQVLTKTETGANWADPPAAQQVWSTEETVIGTWVNGKPRYRMAFEGFIGSKTIEPQSMYTYRAWNNTISNFSSYNCLLTCKILGNIPGVVEYFNDILITGAAVSSDGSVDVYIYNPSTAKSINLGADRFIASLEYCKTSD